MDVLVDLVESDSIVARSGASTLEIDGVAYVQSQQVRVRVAQANAYDLWA